MNGFLEIVILFCLIFVLFKYGNTLGLSSMNDMNISSDKYLFVKQKLIAVFIIFIAYIVLLLMSSLFNKTEFSGEIIAKSILTSIFAFIGITIYFDIVQGMISKPNYSNLIKTISITSAIILFAYFTNVGPRLDINAIGTIISKNMFELGKQIGASTITTTKEVAQEVKKN